jgi:hypothetical protein
MTRYTITDISMNRIKINEIFQLMLKENAEQEYEYYSLYKDTFETFAYDIIDSIQLMETKQDESLTPAFMEEDKYLLIRPKQKTIIDIFQTVNKTLGS